MADGSCKAHMEAASAMIDGEMSWSARLKLRVHLLICKHCRRYFKQLDTICDALGQVCEEEHDHEEQATDRLLDKMFSDEPEPHS